MPHVTGGLVTRVMHVRLGVNAPLTGTMRCASHRDSLTLNYTIVVAERLSHTASKFNAGSTSPTVTHCHCESESPCHGNLFPGRIVTICHCGTSVHAAALVISSLQYSVRKEPAIIQSSPGAFNEGF